MWINRHKTMVNAALVGMVGVLLATLVMAPLYRENRELVAKLEIKTKERNDLTNRVTLLSQLDQNILRERVQILDSALPPRKDVLLYLASINGLSSELGLSFGGVNLAPGELTEATGAAKRTSQSGGLSTLESEVKIQGTKESVYAFLRAIEEVLPLMQIKDIKITVSGERYVLSLNLGMLWAEASTTDVKGPVALFGEEEEKYFRQLAGYRSYPNITDQILPGTVGVKQNVFSPPTIPPQP